MGVDINCEDVRGSTALTAAAEEGSLICLKFLIQHGADVNKEDAEGCAPINLAVDENNLDCSKYLIQNGADINNTDEDGWTPLHAASANGYLDCIEYFQEVIPVKSEPASHTEQNNTAAMAAPPEPPYDSVGGSWHGVVADQGAENSMYGDGDYEDYEQYESKADGSFYVSMMGAGKVGSASADGNKELDQMIAEKMSQIYSDSGCKPTWKCDICGKASNNKTHMTNHVETHFEGLVQPCPHCNKMLRTRESLRIHIRRIHKKK